MLKKKNVVGLGQGFKYKAGEKTDEKCLLVFVQKKQPVSQLDKNDIVPKEVNDIRTDVKDVGKVVAYKSRTSRWRPAPGGVSIGHYLITAGTLGAIVKDATTGEQLILSNNHVMANSNDAFKGDAIIQPGAADGGRAPQDTIANLERFIRIEMSSGGNGGGDICPFAKGIASFLNVAAKLVGSQSRLFTTRPSQEANLVDAAVAKPVDGSAIDDEIIDIGKIDGIIQAELGMEVRKSGRTTGTTTGTIDALDVTIQVGYGGGAVAEFQNQILTSDMSQPGDSGSLLVHATENKAVGLLFAGSDEVTVHSPIETVLDLLNITF
ncbi:hypothetical protein GF337_16375 [candidate division KSB1 bacterium]|nr:hypothetical protein [candidate division KSB1 bacterium]